MKQIDVAKLNTGTIVQLIKHDRAVQFDQGRWSLVGQLNKHPRQQMIWWVPTTSIAKAWTIA